MNARIHTGHWPSGASQRAHTQSGRGLIGGVLLCAVIAAGCGSDPAGKDGGKTHDYGLPAEQLAGLQAINTSLSAAKTAAGVSVEVACVGTPGDVVITHPTFEVTPQGEFEINGATLTIKTAGLYAVACTIAVGDLRDDTPEQLVVVPAKATEIQTKVEPAKIGGGATAKVTCSGLDAFGNDVSKGDGSWTAEVTPTALASAKDLTLTGGKSGKGLVQCLWSDTAEGAAKHPADLEVIPGTPFKTFATVDPGTVAAGESAQATCKLEDAAGNPLDAPAGDFTLESTEGLKFDGLKASSEKAATYEIKCRHKSGKTEQEAAKLIVKAADPVSWYLVPSPTKEPKPGVYVYAAGNTVKMIGRGEDKFGNEIKSMNIQAPATFKPEEGIKKNGEPEVKSYTLQIDGKYTVTATLADFPALGEKSVELLVDSTGPMVLISEPKRADTLKDSDKVMVKGTVLDELSPLKSFELNGQVVKVEGDGSFALETTAVHAMNPLIWVALDEWDNKSDGVQTYYYSTKWYDMAFDKPKESFVNDGIGFWMGQSMIDSPPHDHSAPKDLATVVEIFLKHLDLSSMLGTGFPIKQQGFDGQATFENIKFGDQNFNKGYPEIAITVIDGGLHMVGKIHNFSMDVALSGKLLGVAIPKQVATITAKTIEISFDMMLTVDEATGKITSAAKDVDVNFVNMSIKLQGVLGFLSNWLLTAIQPILTPLLEATIKDQLGKVLADQLGAALSALALNQEMEIPPLIGKGDPVKVKITSGVGQLKFWPTKVQNGGILFGMDASVTSEKKVDHKVLGSLARAGCLVPGVVEVFNPGQKFPLEIGLADDFVNQLLFAIWNGGLLKLKLGEDMFGSVDLTQFGVKDLSIETDFMLPPVFTSCVGDGTVKLQLGDLHMHAMLSMNGKPIDIWLYVTLQATVEIKGVNNPKTGATEIGFSLKEIDFLELEVDKINEEAKSLEGLFVKLIKDVMMPKLMEGLGSSLGSFPLPAIDLSSISPQIPKDTKLELDIKSIANEKGYAYLRGNLK